MRSTNRLFSKPSSERKWVSIAASDVMMADRFAPLIKEMSEFLIKNIAHSDMNALPFKSVSSRFERNSDFSFSISGFDVELFVWFMGLLCVCTVVFLGCIYLVVVV